MAGKGFVTVALPFELVQEIDNIVKAKKYGYRNRPEVVKEGVRKLIREIKTGI